MEFICVILSGLALLAATVCLVLIFREKKRSAKRNAALVRSVQQEVKTAFTAAGNYVDEHMKKCYEHIEKLEQGITPDYEAAKQAANAVNDFSKGISNILGFDPMEALKVERQKGMGDPD